MTRGAPNAPDWLTARPIAHRGFHDKGQRRVENSLAAAEAAIARQYAIECDVQLSQDGEAIVFHDFTLDRLTQAHGDIGGVTAAKLRTLLYKDGSGRLSTLEELLATISGQTPLIIEIKSRFDGDRRLAARTAAIVAAYNGPVAIKSFDPDVLRALRGAALAAPLGLIAEATYDHEEWAHLSIAAKAALKAFSFYPEIRPDFLSWAAADLPHAIPKLCRDGIGMPVMAWTLRSQEARKRVAPCVDQIIFEGFDA